MNRCLKPCRLLVLLLLVMHVSSAQNISKDTPDIVVRKLYQQIVLRKPHGFPDGQDQKAIGLFLSRDLIHRLDDGKACRDDYLRKRAGSTDKPPYAWVEDGLFSGGNEEASPTAATVYRTVTEKNGTYRVYVRLTWKETFETFGRKPNPTDTFQWNVAAQVITEGGRFVVNDIILFEEDSTKVARRLSQTVGIDCDGSKWIGDRIR